MFAFLRSSRKWRKAKSPRVDNATVTLCLKSLFGSTRKTHNRQYWFKTLYVHFWYFFNICFHVRIIQNFIPPRLACVQIFPSVFSAAVTLSVSPTCVRRWKGTEQMGIRLKRWDAPNYLMSKGIGLICRFSTLVRLSGRNRLRSHRGSIYPDLLHKCLQYWKSEVR